jgi:hypothetical protein
MSLRASIIRLAYSNPELRPHLIPLVAEAPAEDQGEDAAPTSPQGKGVSKLMLKFLEEEGDRKLKNPDTDNMVKIKTLSSKPKDSAANKLFKREFDRWVKSLKSKDKKTDSTEGKGEGTSPPDKKLDLKNFYEDKGSLSSFTEEYHKSIRSKIPKKQKNALYTYTGSAYIEINRDLRAGEEGLERSDYQEEIESMDSFFSSPEGKVPLDILVKRGAGQQHPFYSMAKNKTLVPGVTFTDNGYTSTAITGKPFGGAVSIEIEVPKGSAAVYLGPPTEDFSEFSHENELLIDRGATFEVVSVKSTEYEVSVRCRLISTKNGGAK